MEILVPVGSAKPGYGLPGDEIPPWYSQNCEKHFCLWAPQKALELRWKHPGSGRDSEVRVTDHPVADRFRPGRLRIAQSLVPHGGDDPCPVPPAERRCEGGS